MDPTMTRLSQIALTLTWLAVSSCSKSSAESQNPPAALVQVGGAIAINVTADGYQPASVTAPAGKPAHMVFTRISDQGCGQQLVFPALGIKKDLPLNQPVEVDVTMPASGSVSFTCGMDMYRGSIVAQ
jgi:plastocyanin domain-containing protein